RRSGSSTILGAKRHHTSLAHIAKQLQNDEKIFVLEYLNNCFEQAKAQLSQVFEKNDLEKFVKELQQKTN
ncbi:DUF2254 domain-containing protein, partial [Francisella tularensis subsp. holarctica]|nr:DUF2254 domain-containing protein [Francisella tularensis subsp. holarctica]